MAAGNARRFGSNKLTMEVDGRSLIRRALDAIPPCTFKTVVVSQYPEILTLAQEFGFRAILNSHPELGASHTLRLGLSELQDCSGVMFLVADQPLLTRESVSALAHFWRQQPEKIAALGSGGVRGNPCLFPARFFPELLELEGDRGGSAVIRRHEDDLILLEVLPQELTDVDTPSALEQLRQTDFK